MANDDGGSSCSCSECGADDDDDDDDGARTAWSEASRSLLEPESSTASGPAKSSETASLSTDDMRDVDARPLGGT
ncbi:hypothetical protein CDD83_3161 [Cordyceps sp. RAO-2017]|nr:hypothetical protein CDD83_3161 [Cordyceps sp. RAO-2017]